MRSQVGTRRGKHSLAGRHRATQEVVGHAWTRACAWCCTPERRARGGTVGVEHGRLATRVGNAEHVAPGSDSGVCADALHARATADRAGVGGIADARAIGGVGANGCVCVRLGSNGCVCVRVEADISAGILTGEHRRRRARSQEDDERSDHVSLGHEHICSRWLPRLDRSIR